MQLLAALAVLLGTTTIAGILLMFAGFFAALLIARLRGNHANNE